ncbi:MAG: bifunctional 4-hydroxy-2-oxoglutarate aldolase/2-dehydro-3-deoxy-phosphogluconate aldolase [Bacteroidota bacterium]|nr:bifunctional 4-hydroxy-2-oxoglutarate aldolase/2-dehydro-3-deoxy-phosphogluconate aldolase [Bacteroidota bacterium]MDE2834695.1 bifunctional 4-hydroxy-2-oxoglutarate aldolase/2-dehydro-3-deoxy-phosphogluconate aldolase [Bacteroidota bacterium]
MIREEITQRLVEAGAVAIFRTRQRHPLQPAAEALVQGGITALEVTLTTPGALETIAHLADAFMPDILIGAGSVVTADQVSSVASAGASFVVSPVARPEIIRAAHDRGLPVMPGVFTPTEADAAQALGADLLKVFPAGFLGPKYISALRAPMPHLRLVPTGGVRPDNAHIWMRAGATAVGIGSALADERTILNGDLATLTARARTLMLNIDKGKQQERKP